MVVCNKYIPRTMARLSNFETVASRMPMRRAGPNVVTNAVSFHGLIASGTFNSSKKEGDKLVIDYTAEISVLISLVGRSNRVPVYF
jgi:hypothetical protein